MKTIPIVVGVLLTIFVVTFGGSAAAEEVELFNGTNLDGWVPLLTTDDVPPAQRAELERQVSLTIGQQDQQLDMRLAGDVDADLFANKQVGLRDRMENLKLELDALDHSYDETADIAERVIELSQILRQQWTTADCAAKRRILEIVFLNCRLDDATIVPTIRKPFDVLADERCISGSWGTRI
jgi:hypothetical protein